MLLTSGAGAIVSCCARFLALPPATHTAAGSDAALTSVCCGWRSRSTRNSLNTYKHNLIGIVPFANATMCFRLPNCSRTARDGHRHDAGHLRACCMAPERVSQLQQRHMLWIVLQCSQNENLHGCTSSSLNSASLSRQKSSKACLKGQSNVLCDTHRIE